jgi:hypothetical protein
MNAPWFHPDQIDWQDGLNPRAKPAYRPTRNPAVYRALQQPTMQALRDTPGLLLRLFAAPETSMSSLPGGATYDVLVHLDAGSWIIGVSAASAQPEGFLAQITMPTATQLFTQPVSSASIKNARPLFLSRPAGIPNAGPIKVRLINQSLNPNACQFAVWVVQ